jgi:hypothetical protein
VKGKLQAISPTALRALIEQAFNDALNLLDVEQLLPHDQVAALDATYQQIIDDLKAFDPKKLVTDVVQPVYDSTIPPLLKAFDVTALFKAVGDTLDALKGELQTELDKVNQHYKAMLAAVPSLSLDDVAGAAASVAGDVAGALGF